MKITDAELSSSFRVESLSHQDLASENLLLTFCKLLFKLSLCRSCLASQPTLHRTHCGGVDTLLFQFSTSLATTKKNKGS